MFGILRELLGQAATTANTEEVAIKVWSRRPGSNRHLVFDERAPQSEAVRIAKAQAMQYQAENPDATVYYLPQ